MRRGVRAGLRVDAEGDRDLVRSEEDDARAVCESWPDLELSSAGEETRHTGVRIVRARCARIGCIQNGFVHKPYATVTAEG